MPTSASSPTRPRSAFLADRARFAAMRGQESRAFGKLRPDQAFGLVGRAKSAFAERLEVGRRASVTRYVVVDIAVLGGNALLASVAAARAIEKGLTTLLAAEPSLADVPEGLTDDPAFVTLVDRLLLDRGAQSSSARESRFEAAIRALSVRNADGRVARFGPESQVTVKSLGSGGEAMLLASPRSPSCPSDDLGRRMLISVSARDDGRDVAAGTLTSVFARRVVVCGVGMGIWSDSVAASTRDPRLVLYGSAKRIPFTGVEAARDLMGDLVALSDGRHLHGLTPAP